METFTSKIDFVKRCFGDVRVARDSINVAVKCPCCKSSRKKKLSIDTSTWRYHCWVCGEKGGNPFKIIKKHCGHELASEFSERFLNKRASFEDAEQEVSLKIPDGFVPLYRSLKSRDPDVKDCLSYLSKRGITERQMWYFKLGTVKSGPLRRRIVIPSFDFDGVLNYYSARSIDESSYKYINSKSKKKDIIFNEINIDWSSELTIVEGPFDLFSCDFNSTCLLGSSLSLDSYLFKRIASNKTPVLLALDEDMKQKSAKIADTLLGYGSKVRILNLSGYSDVGEMSRDDFLSRKASAPEWGTNDSLMTKISGLRSGSLF